MYVFVYAMYMGTHRGQKRTPDALELELKGIMNCLTWVLGTELETCKVQSY